MGYCVGCKITWSGSKRSHCTGCHKTFSSPAMHSAHQTIDKKRCQVTCKDPSTLGMVEKEGVWTIPIPEEYKFWKKPAGVAVVEVEEADETEEKEVENEGD